MIAAVTSKSIQHKSNLEYNLRTFHTLYLTVPVTYHPNKSIVVIVLVRDLVFQNIKVVLDWLILFSLSNAFVQHILRKFYVCVWRLSTTVLHYYYCKLGTIISHSMLKYNCKIFLILSRSNVNSDAAIRVPEQCKLHGILIWQ